VGQPPFPRIVTREIALAVLARTLSHETRTEAELSQIASHAGADTERLVKDAVLLLLERDACFRAAVRKRKVPPLRFAPVGMTELWLRFGRDDRVVASLRSG
jgi:hypothetical protein